MKVTAMVILAIGVVLLMISGLMAMQAQDTRTGSGMVAEDPGLMMSCMWPAAIGTTALVTGGLMLLYGGRGWRIVNDEPAIHG